MLMTAFYDHLLINKDDFGPTYSSILFFTVKNKIENHTIFVSGM